VALGLGCPIGLAEGGATVGNGDVSGPVGVAVATSVGGGLSLTGGVGAGPLVHAATSQQASAR
jgi:hypothetical protein